MEMLVFGRHGLAVVVFPTSMGRFYEYEDRSMVTALADKIDGGFIQLYCVDSIDSESWYSRSLHPRQRIDRHVEYERYVLNEVAALIHQRQPAGSDGRIAVTGCSLGAFHAAEIAFRYPRSVQKLVALSGKYENSSFLDGFADDAAYFTNPLAFLAGLSRPADIEPLRAMEIVIVTGSTDPHVEEARQLSRILFDKGISNRLDIWDGWMHDWPYWHAMIRQYL
jgi:esterase/lipase superfamily enzyme